MVDYYTHCADDYHRQTFYLDPTSFLLPLAERLLPGAFVLDVGCGSGRDLLWFKNRGFRVLGFDRSYPLACLAQRLAGCNVIVGDFERFDFSRLCADALLLVGALVHIPHGALARVLGNILRALKPDGLTLLSMKEGRNFSHGPCGSLFYYWSDGKLQELFQALGLETLHRHRQVSLKNAQDVWLSYVLRRKHSLRRALVDGHGLQKARSR